MNDCKNLIPPQLEDFRQQVSEYGAHLTSGGSQENWNQVIDVEGVDRADQVLEHLFCAFVIKYPKPQLSQTELDAFVQLSHACLHELLVYYREKRSTAVNGWNYLQRLINHAVTHTETVQQEALRDFLFLVTDIGLIFDPPVRQAIREWMENLFDQQLDGQKEASQIHGHLARWHDPFLSLINQVTEGGKVVNEFDCYGSIENQLTFLPESSIQDIVTHGLSFSRPMVKEIIPLIVLHPCDDIAEIVLDILLNEYGSVTPLGLSRLICMRNWLPVIRQPLLDQVIRVVRRGLAGDAEANDNPSHAHNSTCVRQLASTVDGSGAQNIIAMYKSSAGFRVFVGVVKEHVGWVDVWASGWTTRAECERIIRSFQKSLYSLDVSNDYLSFIFAQGLAWNVESQLLPHPQFLQWVETAKISPLNPNDFGTEAIAALIDIDEDFRLTPFQVKQTLDVSKRWLRQGQFAMGWFESGDHVENYLAELIPEDVPDIVEDCVEQIFEPLRDKWQDRLNRMAFWAYCNGKRRGPKAVDFYVMSKLMGSDFPLHNLPFVRDLAVATLTAYTYRDD